MCFVYVSSNRCRIVRLWSWPIERITTAPLLSAGLTAIVSTLLNFESSYCSILERLLLDFVSIFSRFNLFRTSNWGSKSLYLFRGGVKVDCFWKRFSSESFAFLFWKNLARIICKCDFFGFCLGYIHFGNMFDTVYYFLVY